jgi:Predicted membrane protein (DUF2079)
VAPRVARAPVTIDAVATSLELPTIGEEAPGALTPTGSSTAAPAPTVLRGALRTAWFIGVAVFAAQFILLLLHSWYLWDHFDLTSDFGQYSQAWQQIATGHLNPYDTTYAWYYPHYGYPFYQADLELILWPLSLLYWVYPHSIDLLIVQDVALAGAGLVAYRWVLEHLQLHAPSRRFALLVGGGVLLVLVLQPWTYWAASYDYHSEPLAAFFVLLAGRDLWAGRRRGWVWVALTLLCGNVAASYVVALGIAAIISGRRRWRTGLVLVLVGAAWLGLVGLVHSGKGAALSAYAYLDHRTTVNDTIGGIVTIVTGMAIHPGIAARTLSHRWSDVYQFVSGAGTIGVFSAFGGVLAVVVLAPSALNSSPAFISAIGGAQNIMAVLAVAVGIAMLATWLTRQGEGHSPRWRTGLTAAALALVLAAVVQSAVVSAHQTPLSGQTFERVDSGAASALAAVSARVPQQDEVIVSQGVSGRFGQRHNFYPYFGAFADGQTVPVFGHTVYVVLTPTQGLEPAPVASTNAAIALMRGLGARQIEARDGVYAFAWQVPEGRHSITFPVS